MFKMLMAHPEVIVVEQHLGDDYHLMQAVQAGHIDIVRIVLQNTTFSIPMEYYITEALSTRNLELIELLIDRTADQPEFDIVALVEVARRSNLPEVSNFLLTIPRIRDGYEQLQLRRLG